MYNQHNTAIIQKINVTSALSRVESALYREDVTAVVGFLASKKGRSVDEYEILVATDYCCCRRNSHADITDETVTTRLVDHHSVPPAQRVAPRRSQNHGTHFTWDETPYQSATSLFYERRSLRPSYVLHMRRRRRTQTDNFNSTD